MSAVCPCRFATSSYSVSGPDWFRRNQPATPATAANANGGIRMCLAPAPDTPLRYGPPYSFGIIALAAARRTPRFRLRAPTRVMAVGRDGEAGRRTTISSPTPMVPGLLTVA